MHHPQVQCAALRASDFDATGFVIVTTRLASGFTVERMRPNTYWVSSCPTFPGGLAFGSLASLRQRLSRE